MAKTRKRSSDNKTTKTTGKKSSKKKSSSPETERRPSGKRSRSREGGEGRRSKRKERRYTSARDWASQETSSQFSSPSLDLPEGVELYRLEEPGTIYLDILPYEVGENNPRADQGMFHFERTFFVHWVPTPDGRGKFHTCLSRTFEEACPVCEEMQELRQDPEADEDLIKKMAPKKRQMFNVVDRKNRKKGVQIFELSYHNFGALLKEEMDDPTEDHSGFFYHDGEMLKLRVVEAQIESTTFNKIGKIEFKERLKDLSDDVLDQVHCLDDLVAHPTYEEMDAAIKRSERAAADDDDDDNDGKPKGKKRTAKKKSTKGKPAKKKAQQDDDDWDDDADDTNGHDPDDDFDDDDFDDDDATDGDNDATDGDDDQGTQNGDDDQGTQNGDDDDIDGDDDDFDGDDPDDDGDDDDTNDDDWD